MSSQSRCKTYGEISAPPLGGRPCDLSSFSARWGRSVWLLKQEGETREAVVQGRRLPFAIVAPVRRRLQWVSPSPSWLGSREGTPRSVWVTDPRSVGGQTRWLQHRAPTLRASSWSSLTPRSSPPSLPPRAALHFLRTTGKPPTTHSRPLPGGELGIGNYEVHRCSAVLEAVLASRNTRTVLRGGHRACWRISGHMDAVGTGKTVPRWLAQAAVSDAARGPVERLDGRPGTR